MLDPEDRLKIADRFTPIPVGGAEYRLQSLTTSLVLKGQAPDLMERLIPLLDSERTVREVVDELAAFGEAAVHASLEHLLEAGALDRADQIGAGVLPPDEIRRLRAQTAFFSHFVAPPDAGTACTPVGNSPSSGLEFQERIRQARVAIFSIGRIGSQLVRSLAVAGVGAINAVDSTMVGETDLGGDGWFGAADLGLNRAEAAGRRCAEVNPTLAFSAAREPEDDAALRAMLADCNLAILCPDHFDPGAYEAFNRAALISRCTWTSARFAGFEFHIGPTVIPGQTPCYECFRLRINSNVADYDEHILLENFRRHNRIREEALAITPAAGLLALEVLKALTWFAAPATCAHLYSLNLLTLQCELHPVLKIPRCPACGRPSMPRPTIHAWQQTRAEPLS